MILFFGVGQTITIPISPTIGGVKWVTTIGGDYTCAHSKHNSGQNCKHRVFEFIIFFHSNLFH
jgi:hypothetical protein